MTVLAFRSLLGMDGSPPPVQASIASFTVTFGTGADTTIDCTKPTGTVDGNRLIAIHYMDPDTTSGGGGASQMTAPAGWTQSGSTHNVTGAGICKVWTKTASSEGASYIFGGGDASDSTIYILRVIDSVGITVVPSFAGSATVSASHIAPSVTPLADSALVICSWFALNQNAAGTSWGASPSPLTNLNLVDQSSASPYIRTRVAYAENQLATAFGTKTITHSNTRAWLAVSFVVSSDITITPKTGSDTLTQDDSAATAASISATVPGSDTQTLSDVTPALANTLVASDTQTLTEATPAVAITQFVVGSDTQTLSPESSIVSPLVTDTQTLTEGTPTILIALDVQATDTQTLIEGTSVVDVTFIKAGSDTQTLTTPNEVATISVTASRTDTQTLSDLTPSYTSTFSRTDTLTLNDLSAFDLLALLYRTDSFHVLNFASINFPPIPRRIYGSVEVPEIALELTKIEFYGGVFVVVAYGGTVEVVHNISGSVLED